MQRTQACQDMGDLTLKDALLLLMDVAFGRMIKDPRHQRKQHKRRDKVDHEEADQTALFTLGQTGTPCF